MANFDVLKSKYDIKDSKEILSSTISLVDLILQNCVIHAFNILFDYVGRKVETKQEDAFNRTAYFIAKLLKPFHLSFYNELCELQSKELLKKFHKIRKIEKMYFFDEDYVQIYNILKTICDNLWYVPIMHQFIKGFDPMKIEFDVNAFCHSVVMCERK